MDVTRATGMIGSIVILLFFSKLSRPWERNNEITKKERKRDAEIETETERENAIDRVWRKSRLNGRKG